jgi:hypothetical protein
MHSGVYKLLFFLFILLISVFSLLTSSRQPHSASPDEISPCTKPDTYRMGEIDNRYLITENDLYRVLREVSDVWSEALGRPVMEYAEDGEIQVNLVYAEQQELSDRESRFRDRLMNEQQTIASLEQEYERMDAGYKESVSEHQGHLNELQQKIEDLNSWVVRKNEEGGFRDNELQLFEERKQQLDSLMATLNRRGQQLNREAQVLNQKIDQINDKVDRKNEMIEEYNRTFTGTQRFTQGSYEWMGNERTINVFQFIDEEDLKLVLAHEVGHALGIGHVDNPQSVMYHLMGNQARGGIQLTEEDRQALIDICSGEVSSN